MCGIAGIFSFRKNESEVELLNLVRLMGDAIVHRGPDGRGEYVDAQAGLALVHQRLSIVDLSPAGSQPMVSSCGRYVICYNGELYNTDELRSHVSLSDISWRGRSDTEVLVESIARRGIDQTVHDLNGMFAFGLWDRTERSLTLARDRMGIKPLFVFRYGDRVAFASELKSLRAAHIFPGIDESSLSSFLRFGYIPGACSIYQGISKVLPGEIITISSCGMESPRHYWELSVAVEKASGQLCDIGDDEAVDSLEKLLLDAVDRQVIADVPVGAFLSGGIDSSLISAMMVKRGGQVRTFSIGFPDFGYDESKYASDVSRHLGTVHSEMFVSGREALDLVPSLCEIWDEPFADSSQIPTLLLSKLTRSSVSVALSGDGADELFAGYNRYIFARRYWPFVEKIPRGLRRSFAKLLNVPSVSVVDSTFAYLPGFPNQMGDKLRKVSSILPLDALSVYGRLTSLIPDPSLHLTSGREWIADAASPSGLGLLDRMRHNDLKSYLPDDILQKVDRASMAVSLEVRPPFLDHRVVEFAWSLPERCLIRHGQSKWILKRVLERYVPPALFDRPKMGFGVPLADWLRGPLLGWASDLIYSSDYGGGLLNPLAARRLLREHTDGSRNHAYQIWTLLMFESWRRHWT